MAMNATMMTDSGGRSSDGLGDMDINAESFYIGYKLLGQLNPSLDSFKSDVMSVNESLVAYVGCSFSSVKSNVTNMRTELDDLYKNMVNFKGVLEKIDSSNALLFSSIDAQMSGGFGEEMSETDFALMLEELKKIYDEAKKKNPSELTDYEKEVLSAYEPYAKLDDYNSGVSKLEEIEESLRKKRQELNLCSMSARYGAGSVANTERMTALSKEIAELDKQKKAISSDNKELRAYLLENGLVEPTGMETIKAAGASLFESGKDAANALLSGDKDALIKAGNFITELKATGAVVQNSITSGVLKLGEYLLDGASIVVTTGASVFTGSYDLLQKAYSELTGAEYSSVTKALWADTMDSVEVDRVGELNKKFYTETSIGKFINENSALKYDSAGAKLIQNGTTKAAEMVAATAVTVATGGAAAPFVAAGIGLIEGVGKTGEEQFAAGNKNAKGVMLAYLGGVGKAAEWYGYGQVGGNVVNAFNKLGSAGATAVANNASKEVLEKTLNENLFKKAINKTFTTADVYLDTAAAGANAVSTRITTGEWNAGEMALDFGLAVGGNVLGDVVSGLADKKAARKALGELAENANKTGGINEFGEIINKDNAIFPNDPNMTVFTPPDGNAVGKDISIEDFLSDDPGITLDGNGNPMKSTKTIAAADAVASKKGFASSVEPTAPMPYEMYPQSGGKAGPSGVTTATKASDANNSSAFKNGLSSDPSITLAGNGNPMNSPKTIAAADAVASKKGFASSVEPTAPMPYEMYPQSGGKAGPSGVTTATKVSDANNSSAFKNGLSSDPSITLAGNGNPMNSPKTIAAADAVASKKGFASSVEATAPMYPQSGGKASPSSVTTATKVSDANAAKAAFEAKKQEELSKFATKMQDEYAKIGNNVFDPKKNLLARKHQLEKYLMNYAHSNGMTFEDFVKSCGKIDQLDETTQKIVNKYAHQVFENAAAAESEISSMMKSLEVDGIFLTGYDHRFKKEDSIARKIASSIGLSKSESNIAFSASQINDSLRYTLILDDGKYGSQLYDSLHKLIDEGYVVRDINNKWGNSVYQGINATLVAPNGTLFELQFHTIDSFCAKEMLNHQYYEIFRSSLAKPEHIKAAKEIMEINQTLNVKTMNDMVGLTKSDIVKKASFKQYKVFEYPKFLKHYEAKVKDWHSKLTPGQKQLFANYIGEGIEIQPGSYPAINGLKRGTLLDFKNKTISFFTTTSTGVGKKMSFADFEKYYLPVTSYDGKVITNMSDWIDMQHDAFNELQNAIGSMELDESTLLYRGINMNALTCLVDGNGVNLGIDPNDSLETIFNKLKKLGVYVDNGLMSTSPVPTNITTSKDIVFKLECKKGVKGVDLTSVGGYENEVLLAGGQGFDITGYGTEIIEYEGYENFQKVIKKVPKNVIYLTAR